MHRKHTTRLPTSPRPPAAPSAPPTTTAELWVSKHAPRTESDLVVHKKKVQEVQQWLEWQRGSLGRAGISRVAMVTGELSRGWQSGWLGGARYCGRGAGRCVQKGTWPQWMADFWQWCACGRLRQGSVG